MGIVKWLTSRTAGVSIEGRQDQYLIGRAVAATAPRECFAAVEMFQRHYLLSRNERFRTLLSASDRDFDHKKCEGRVTTA